MSEKSGSNWSKGLILDKKDAIYAANRFTEYFKNFEHIIDYFKEVKKERIEKMPQPMFGMSWGDDFFQNWDMHPEDMDFELRDATSETFHHYLELVASHPNEASIPGRHIRYMLYEKNTNTIAGFIRLGSPVMSIRPRNQYLEGVVGMNGNISLSTFNKHSINGFIIVPAQPFGFNYLGGKLLAGLCCTAEVKEHLDSKYDMNTCLFETTSLYGSSKQLSQYDGMKPFIRFKGLTDSSFSPNMHDGVFLDFNKWFTEKNDGVRIVDPTVSGRKMKTQMRMISIIKQSLKEHDEQEYKKFVEFHKESTNLNEQKRFFISTYGYENVPQIIRGEETELRKAPNFDRYTQQGILDWWRPKAARRYEQLKKDGRLRTSLEIWSETFDIDILREGK